MEIRYLASGLPHFLRLLHISLNISFRIQPLSSLVPIRNKLEHFVAISLQLSQYSEPRRLLDKTREERKGE